MKIVDPHIHFWDTSAVRYTWLENPTVAYSGDNRLLPKQFLFENVCAELDCIEILRTVHIEANPDDAIAEARWLQSLASSPSRAGHPHAIVARADLSLPDAPGMLERLSSFSRVRGIRQILNRHRDPRFNYVERDYLSDPLWRDNLRRLATFGWSFDLQLYPTQAAAAADLIGRNPDIFFIVNHAAMYADRTLAGWRSWRRAVRELAALPNVSMKISGLAMFDHSWSIESFRPIVLETLDSFGVDRCMFASNFPIDSLHGSYGKLWRAYEEIVTDLSAAERHALFVENAIRCYRLPPI
jgi:predicted TIM-barrel fold metal-dependent hydrolase